jgi:DNA-binding MarR family transcriptional regulator
MLTAARIVGALLQLAPDQPVTMRALAARLQYDPSNLTGVIDRLERIAGPPGDAMILEP